jgi:hypothetical protein
MKKLVIIGIAFGFVAVSAFAQNGNPCPGDKEYQLNIIGTSDKNPDMTNNNGHRIFVPLSGKTKIYMTGDTDTLDGTTNGTLNCGNKFDVLDANGTDGTAILLVPCDPLTAANLNPSVCYDVYATPLAHGGYANVDVVCEFDATCLGCDIDGGSCDMGNLDIYLSRGPGKPVTQDITGVFRASGCLDLNNSGVCDAGDIDFHNEWIFNIAALEAYYWDYDNHGNRLTQIRFCNVEGVEGSDCGPNTIVTE